MKIAGVPSGGTNAARNAVALSAGTSAVRNGCARTFAIFAGAAGFRSADLPRPARKTAGRAAAPTGCATAGRFCDATSAATGAGLIGSTVGSTAGLRVATGCGLGSAAPPARSAVRTAVSAGICVSSAGPSSFPCAIVGFIAVAGSPLS